uniref:Domain of unknown function with conserved HDNR motif domain-containing protein n=1 Tax=Sarcophilus harrisii TaxID=9305 RepID=A0A7N4NX77_SARHA
MGTSLADEEVRLDFPHLGLIEKTPESTTATMLKQPYLPESRRKVEDLLPFRYQFRQKQANKSNYPFSMHDNRHGLEFCGHGLDEVSIENLLSRNAEPLFPKGIPAKKQGEFEMKIAPKAWATVALKMCTSSLVSSHLAKTAIPGAVLRSSHGLQDAATRFCQNVGPRSISHTAHCLSF